MAGDRNNFSFQKKKTFYLTDFILSENLFKKNQGLNYVLFFSNFSSVIAKIIYRE